MEIEIKKYYPPRVSEIIACSFDFFVGRIDDHTVLKYPHGEQNLCADAQTRLDVEAHIYTILGDHDRIIGFKGGDRLGIRLEFAVNRSISQYIKQINPYPTIQQRLKWSQQAAEGTVYIHSLGVLHCDINVNNLLLDKNLNVKLADFQGRYMSSDRITLLDGLSSENVKSSMPRSNNNHADQKTDIFALGSAIYHIMTGHEPFPELDSLNDDHEAEITSQFRSGQFPHLDLDLGGHVVHNCWAGAYLSAVSIVEDLEVLLSKVEI